MKPAADRMKDVLGPVGYPGGPDSYGDQRFRLSASGRRTNIRKALVEQMASPVLWEDSIRRMMDEGVDTFVEIGPGNVLTGLVRKIQRGVTALSVQDGGIDEENYWIKWGKEGEYVIR